MSRRKKRNTVREPAAASESPPPASDRPFDPPRPHKLLLGVTGVLLAAWIAFLAVLAVGVY